MRGIFIIHYVVYFVQLLPPGKLLAVMESTKRVHQEIAQFEIMPEMKERLIELLKTFPLLTFVQKGLPFATLQLLFLLEAGSLDV